MIMTIFMITMIICMIIMMIRSDCFLATMIIAIYLDHFVMIRSGCFLATQLTLLELICSLTMSTNSHLRRGRSIITMMINMMIIIKASEMLVAPRISECFGLPWSALFCYSLL